MRRGWEIAWRGLRRNRRRNAATVAAIAFGYAGLVLLGGYAARVEAYLRTNVVYLQQAGHVAVWMRDGLDRAESDPVKFQIAPEVREKITALAAKDPRVELTSSFLRGMALAGNGCTTRPVSLVGVEPPVAARLRAHAQVQEWSPELALAARGRWPSEYPKLDEAAAVSAGLATLLYKPRVYDEVQGLPPAPTVLDCDGPQRDAQLAADANVQLVGTTFDGMLNAIDTEMTATFHAAEELGENGSMVVSLPALQRLYATDRVTYVAIWLHQATDAPAVAADLQRALRADGLDVETLTFEEERWAPYYVGTMQFLAGMFSFINLIVTLVLVLTVAGAMTLAILERTREIGTWRALGFERGHVLGLFVREALLVGLIGLALGLLLGLVAAAGVNAAGIRFQPPGVPGSIQLVLRPSIVGCVLPVLYLVPGIAIATWWVVRKQLRRAPADLLSAQAA